MLLQPLLTVVAAVALASTSVAASHSHHARYEHLYKRNTSVNSNNYPKLDVKGPTPKAAWVKTYNASKAAGNIPTFAPSTMKNGNPTYSNTTNVTEICSWTDTYPHCYHESDIYEAPDGYVGVSFDDGPQLASPTLYKFLASKNQSATHFMIGSRISENQAIFQQAISTGGHIAVHTWSHPYMTTLTDEQLLGELGWTAQIIYDLSGHVPAYWRPPYGDVDNRVRAIAREVFGLRTVLWNNDTFDWCFNDDGSSQCAGEEGTPSSEAELVSELHTYYNLPKTEPGPIILEHELTNYSVSGFTSTYPYMLSKGWTPKCIPDLFGYDWYQSTSAAIGDGSGKSFSNNSSSAAASTAAASTAVASSSAATSAASSGVSGLSSASGSAASSAAGTTSGSSTAAASGSSAAASGSSSTSTHATSGAFSLSCNALLAAAALISTSFTLSF